MRRRDVLAVALLGLGPWSLVDAEGGPTLEGVKWRLVELGKRDIPKALAEERELYLIFDASQRKTAGEGRVAGFVGCNHVQGGYQRSGYALRFGRLASTRMACSTGYELETYLLRTLERVRGWWIHDGALELLDQSGEVLARFLPSEE